MMLLWLRKNTQLIDEYVALCRIFVLLDRNERHLMQICAMDVEKNAQNCVGLSLEENAHLLSANKGICKA